MRATRRTGHPAGRRTAWYCSRRCLREGRARDKGLLTGRYATGLLKRGCIVPETKRATDQLTLAGRSSHGPRSR